MENSKYSHEQGQLEGSVGYLPIQEWFLKKALTNRNHFNHSFLIHVTGKIDTERLKAALDKLNRRHDMLRAIYRGGTQSYRKESPIAEIRELDIQGKTEKEVHEELTNWQNRFDIEEGYIWQSGIIRGYEDGSERIYIAVHHMVFDAASWPILREDLKALYEGKETGEKGSSYRQWVGAVEGYRKHATAEEKQYWKEIAPEVEEQQCVWTERAEEDAALHYTRIELAEDVMKTLFQVKNCKLNELLLSGLSHALYEVSGLTKNWITMETEGREDIDPRIDVTRTIGWFTTLYPLCLPVGEDIGETVTGIGEMLQKSPHDGIGYGAIQGYEKLPKVLFNYLDKLGGTTESSWQIRFGEASGESMNPDNRYGNVIDINGLSAGGKIRLGVESCLKEEIHTRLCEGFKRNIEAVAAYCKRQGRQQ